jgi:hypothetical protein
VARGELTLTVDVAAPAPVCWAGVTDWDRQGEWMLGTRVRSTATGLEAVTGHPPLGFVDTMEITRWEPPELCEVRHTGRLVRGTGSFRVLDRGARGSSLVWSEQLELPFGRLGTLLWRLARPLGRLGVSVSLHRFARWVESTPPGRRTPS